MATDQPQDTLDGTVEEKYLSQEDDYLGSLNERLRNLGGFTTLANELIQNADDVKGNKFIAFDVRDDALYVENGGVFSDCGNMKTQECPWREKKGYRCDFHSMRNTAGSNKRFLEDVTGAFGIGFISVYQITDHPELISGKRHWIMSPEKTAARRISQRPAENFNGTRFRLPWATDPESPVRQALNRPIITADRIDELIDEFAQALPKASIFLKNLTRIELKRNGHPFRTVNINKTETQVTVDFDEISQIWRIFQGSFEDEADELKSKYPYEIETKRHANVELAFQQGSHETQGLFFAVLPTRDNTGLPFHINADFMPRSDRKGIPLSDQDYQSEWNSTIVRAAAKTLVEVLPKLTDILGPTDFWDLISQLEATNRLVQDNQKDSCFADFWRHVKPALQDMKSVFTSAGYWQYPDKIKLLQNREREEKNIPVLEAINLEIVLPDLNPYRNILLQVGVSVLTVTDLAAQLLKAGLDRPVLLQKAPVWLQSTKFHQMLGAEVEVLLSRPGSVDGEKELKNCAIVRTIDDYCCPAYQVRQAPSSTIKLFEQFDTSYLFVGPKNPEVIASLAPQFNVEDALKLLEQIPVQKLQKLWIDAPTQLVALVDWFKNSRMELNWDRSYVDSLKLLQIWPCAHTLHSLEELFVPGEFSGQPPLQLNGIVEARLLKNHRSFLLEDLNASQLLMIDLARILKAEGLVGCMRPEKAPEWFTDTSMQHALGREISYLLTVDRTPEGRRELAECAIALSIDGWISSPTEMRNASPDAIRVFQWLCAPGYFLGKDNSDGIRKLVAKFGVEDAIELIEETPVDLLQGDWQEKPNQFIDLIGWFKKQSSELRGNEELKDHLRQLRIWPSGDKLHRLDNLMVPGDFDKDPLKLATVVDTRVVKKHRDFLVDDLGATPLTIINYVTELVPQAFQTPELISDEKRHQLVEILADHLGKLHDDESCQQALQSCPIIKCNDGAFYAPGKVYFQTEYVVDVLGASALTAVIPDNRQEAIQSLFEWLGVANSPRPEDIVSRIGALTREPHKPVGDRRATIQRIFSNLAERWQELEGRYEQFEILKNFEWLPAQEDAERWYRPTELFATYQIQLFKTQAKFLDAKNPPRDFIKFLGVHRKPSAGHIVSHLLECARTNQPVHNDVYKFLNSKEYINDDAIIRLRNTRCLLLGDEQAYRRTDQVFWRKHPFGRFRHQLNDEWLAFVHLLRKLNVKETHDTEDVIKVIHEISVEYKTSHNPLDVETHNILLKCWTLLNESLEQGLITRERLFEEFRGQSVIPDDRKLLNLPEMMFFEDRIGLKEKFGGVLDHNVTQRFLGAWQAMEAAGVQPLSRAVRINLVECPNPKTASDVLARLQGRKILVARVLEASPATNGYKPDYSILDRLPVKSTEILKVAYQIEMFHRVFSGAVEDVQVHYDYEPDNLSHQNDNGTGVLYFQTNNGGRPWLSIARELAYVLTPNVEVGQVALGLKEVLGATSPEEAAAILDESGFPQLADVGDLDISNTGPAGLGGDSVTPEPPEYDVDLTLEVTDETDDVSILSGEQVKSNEDEHEEKVIRSDYDHDSEPADDCKPDFWSFNSDEQENVNGDDDVPKTEGKEQVGGTEELGTRGSGSNHGEGNKDFRPAQDQENGKTKKTGSSGKKGTQTGRFRSYVTHERPGSSEHRCRKPREIDEVDKAGIEHVLKYERRAGRKPKEMPHTNPGYDIESYNSDGAVERFIEVKSISDTWGTLGVGLSDTQFLKAQELGEKFWLYVVEHAEEDEVEPVRVQNPASKVNQFFYDGGWRALAEQEQPEKLGQGYKPLQIYSPREVTSYGEE